MSPEIQLTREMVDGVRRSIRDEIGIRFRPGELDGRTLKRIVVQLGLPQKKGEPDFNDPRIIELEKKIGELPDKPVGQAKMVRISRSEGQFREIPYANALPDIETLAAIASESASADTFRFLFAAVFDISGKKDAVFASFKNFAEVRFHLSRGTKSDWHIGHISLTEPGKLQWVFLDEDWQADEKKTENVKELLSRINPKLFQLEYGGSVPVMSPMYETLYWFDASTGELKQRLPGQEYKSVSVGTVPPLYQSPQV